MTFWKRRNVVPCFITFYRKILLWNVLQNLYLFELLLLVYTTQVNSTLRARWLASSEVISQVLFTSEQPKRNKIAFVGILS